MSFGMVEVKFDATMASVDEWRASQKTRMAWTYAVLIPS